MGTAQPGDIAEAAEVVQPDIAIITLVGLDHYSAFRGKEGVATEKGKLVEAVAKTGVVFLNFDDPYVMAMKDRTEARIITFGRSGADYAGTTGASTSLGNMTLTVEAQGTPIKLETQLRGNHNQVAVLAAAACALELGSPAQLVAERIASFKPVFGRFSTHEFTGGPTFILDTAKAPYDSIDAAISVLETSEATKKTLCPGSN